MISVVCSVQFKSVFTSEIVVTHRKSKTADLFHNATLLKKTVAVIYVDIEEVDVIAAADEVSSNSVTGCDVMETGISRITCDALLEFSSKW